MSATHTIQQTHPWPADPDDRMVAYVAYLLATLRKIADMQDDPATMRVTARRAIAEVEGA